MKKIISVLLCIAMLASVMCINTFATSETNVFTYDNITICFDDDSVLDQQSKEIIAEQLVYGADNTSTYGLWCNLFGHSYTVETVTKITHCVYDDAPRCLSEVYEIKSCSRCGETTSERLSWQYIYCCHEE